MKKLVIKLVQLKQVEETNEVDGATVTTKRWVEDYDIVTGNRELQDMPYNFLAQQSESFIKHVATRLIEMELIKLNISEEDTSDRLDNVEAGLCEDSVRDIFNDMIDDCTISVDEIDLSINRY